MQSAICTCSRREFLCKGTSPAGVSKPQRGKRNPEPDHQLIQSAVLICNHDNMVFCLGHFLINIIVLEALSHIPAGNEGQSSLFNLCTLLTAVPVLCRVCSFSGRQQPWIPAHSPSMSWLLGQLLLGKFHQHHSLRSLAGSHGWHLPKCRQAIKHVHERSQSCLRHFFHSTSPPKPALVTAIDWAASSAFLVATVNIC